MPLKRTLCLLACLLCGNGKAELITQTHTVDLSTSSSAQLALKNLSAPTELSFVVNKPSVVLLKVNQVTANVKMSFRGCGSIPFDGFTIDAMDVYRQPEFAVVSIASSDKCSISVEASEEFDKALQTDMTIRLLGNQNERRAYESLMLAGQAWYLYSQTKGDTSESHLRAALIHYDAANEHAQRANNIDLANFSTYQKSTAHHYLGEYSKQGETLRRLLSSSTTSDHWFAVYTTDLAQHEIYDLGKLEQAETRLLSVLQHHDLIHNPLRLADLKQTLASVYAERRLYADAASIFSETKDLILNAGALKRATKSLSSLGYFYLRKGDVLRAYNTYLDTLTLSEQIGDHYTTTDMHIKLATVARSRGEFDKADDYINLAMARVGEFPHSFLPAWAHKEKAEILEKTGQYPIAIDHIIAAQQAFEAVGVPVRAQRMNAQLASLHLQMGQADKAQQYIQQYLSDFAKSLSPIQKARSQNILAKALIKQNDWHTALELQQSALAIYSETDDAFTLAQLQLDMAISHATLGQYKQASELFATSRASLEMLNADSRLNQGIYRYAQKIVDVDPNDALELLKFVGGKVQASHQNLIRRDFRRGYQENLENINSLKIQLDPDLSPKDSLLLSESSRGFELKYNQIQNQLSGVEHNEYEQVFAQLNRNIRDAFIELQRTEASNKAKTNQHIRALSEKRYQLEKAFVESKATGTPISPFTAADLAALQQHLAEDEMVWFIDTAEAQSHAWFIQSKSVQYSSLPSAQALSQNTSNLLASLTDKATQAEMVNDIETLSLQLLDSDNIPASIRTLHVVTDGPLTNFPFSLLKNPTNQRFFHQDIVVMQHHALALLLTQKQNADPKFSIQSALAVGNPAMLTKREDIANQLGYIATPLPFSQRELDALATLLRDNATTLHDANASKQEFINRIDNSYDLVHFATHAIANSDVPEMSGLIFSNHDDSNNLLMTPEIQRLDMQAKLVVLSGCETTKGSQIAGEGMLGLSRAFLESGARNVIGSLWNVSDAATATLMTRFYHYLLTEELSVPLALSNAQRDVRDFKRKDGRRPWRAPYYWAGFVLYGSGS